MLRVGASQPLLVLIQRQGEGVADCKLESFPMLKFSTAGESHGEALIALLSGVPAGLPIDQAFIDRELWRRQQGFGRGGRMRIETDTAHFISGVRRARSSCAIA